MMNKQPISVRFSGSKTAYVTLPKHPHTPGSVAQTIRVGELLEGILGPHVNFDFDSEKRLIGIEILVSDTDLA
jgi:hypothetical protein